MDTSKFVDGVHLFRVVDRVDGGARNAEMRSGKHYLVGTWGLWLLKNHQKWTILQPSLRAIMRAVSLCSGAQTELRRAASKTGVLVITT